MNALYQKLNLKEQKEILVVNAPPSFEPVLADLKGVTVKRDPAQMDAIDFCLVFVEKKAELDHVSALIAPKARGDALLWFAYPKGTSKKYHCDFNRDNGWEVLMGFGFRPIRQVAIDEDWSALRFRRLEFVKAGK